MSIYLKKILPSLGIISPLSGSCQHNIRGRITDRSGKERRKKRGVSSPFLACHSSPSTQAHWVERETRGRGGGWKTLCIWKFPERDVIYVCIRCRFHYGPVAQVRSFQEHRGDLIRLSLITGHAGSGGKLQTRGRRRLRQRERRNRGGIFTTWTHTPHPQG